MNKLLKQLESNLKFRPAQSELCAAFFHTCYHFLKTNAALQPPNPDAVFRQFLNSAFCKVMQIFIGVDTPEATKFFVGKTTFSFRDWIEIIDSINPAAPRVCPKCPFRLFTGTDSILVNEMAFASISSL